MAQDTEHPKNQHESPPQQVDEGPALEWRVHPARRRPWVTAGVTVLVLVISFLVYVMTDSKWFSFFSLVVLYGALAKFYWPTSYRMDNKGVAIKTTTQTLRKEWSLYRSFYPDKNGILLSPFTEPSRLENFRGLYVMFSGNRDEVVKFVSERVGTKKSDGDSKESDA